MVTNRTHAETLVDVLGFYIDARRIYLQAGTMGVSNVDAQALLDRARDQLVHAIEMTLNDFAHVPRGGPPPAPDLMQD